jgi:hypothetical protein
MVLRRSQSLVPPSDAFDFATWRVAKRTVAFTGERAAGLVMPGTNAHGKPRGLALMLGWRRIRVALGIAIGWP